VKPTDRENGISEKRNITRRKFIQNSVYAGVGLAAYGVTGCGQFTSGSDTGSAKPNIIFIFSDQHRSDTMGCAGHPVAITPSLDSLAAQGVLFDRAYTCGPLCMPARASMMTGKYVHEHEVWHNQQTEGADPDGPSHVRRMRDEAGYLTALIGKAHLYKDKAAHKRELEPILQRWGFEYIDEIPGPQANAIVGTSYSDWLGEKYPNFQSYIVQYKAEHLNQNCWDTEDPGIEPYSLSTSEHLDTFTGNQAADWIRGYQDAKPFYLQVNCPGPHDPFDSTAEFREMYPPEDMPEGIMDNTTPSSFAQIFKNLYNIQNMDKEKHQKLQSIYYGKMTLVDRAIGEVLQAVKDRGLEGDTWIIYSSDHGEMLGDHFHMAKMVFYEQSVHVPCIIKPPEGIVSDGWQSTGMTDHFDIVETILEIGGLDPMAGTHGRSLKEQVLEGPEGENPHAGKSRVFSENYNRSMIRTDEYKLVVDYTEASLEPIEFWDLTNDPDELVNEVDNAAYAGIKADLIEQMSTEFEG